MGRLDRLAIDPQGLRGRGRPGLDADLLSEVGVDLLPDPGQPPVAEEAIDGLPGRKVMGEHPPRPAGPQVVEDRIDHGAAVDGGRPTALGGAGLGFRQERVEPLPLVVGQIGRVGLSCHARYH